LADNIEAKARDSAWARSTERKRERWEDGVKEKGLERKGIFRMIGIVGDARDAECHGVESTVFKWGGH